MYNTTVGGGGISDKTTETTCVYYTRTLIVFFRVAQECHDFFFFLSVHTRIRSHAASLLWFIILFLLSLFRHDNCRLKCRTYGARVCAGVSNVYHYCARATFHWSYYLVRRVRRSLFGRETSFRHVNANGRAPANGSKRWRWTTRVRHWPRPPDARAVRSTDPDAPDVSYNLADCPAVVVVACRILVRLP